MAFTPIATKDNGVIFLSTQSPFNVGDIVYTDRDQWGNEIDPILVGTVDELGRYITTGDQIIMRVLVHRADGFPEIIAIPANHTDVLTQADVDDIA